MRMYACVKDMTPAPGNVASYEGLGGNVYLTNSVNLYGLTKVHVTVFG